MGLVWAWEAYGKGSQFLQKKIKHNKKLFYSLYLAVEQPLVITHVEIPTVTENPKNNFSRYWPPAERKILWGVHESESAFGRFWSPEKPIIPQFWGDHHLGVSKNRGTPKWMVYNGKQKLSKPHTHELLFRCNLEPKYWQCRRISTCSVRHATQTVLLVDPILG